MIGEATTAWAFGGPLAGVSPTLAWALLGIVAVLGAAGIVMSYRRTIRPLGTGRRVMLALLRVGLLLALLACLANPVRVERRRAEAPDLAAAARPRLAVLVDRSDSMSVPDNRGRSRLEDALGTWRRLEPAAQKHFGAIAYFSFAEDLRPAVSLQAASARQGDTHATRLYRSAAAVLQDPARRPDAVVVLTDGVETSADPESLLRDAALAAGVPVHFVAGSNRSRAPDPFVRVREWRVPPTAWRNSDFTIEATFEAFSRTDRVVPFTVWQAGRRLMRGELALTAGENVVSRSFPVSVEDPGPVEVALRIGAGDQAPFGARAVTQVLSPQTGRIRILMHQSALDWGLRYFSNALRTDASFEFSTVVTPEVGITIAGGSQPGAAAIGNLPHDAGALERYDCVVLVRLAASRLTPGQQTAVVEFARRGGSVLFLGLDRETMPQLAGAPLAALLPVELPAVRPTAPAELGPEALRKSVLERIAQAPRPGVEAATVAAPLTPFALTEAGRAAPIFQQGRGGEPLLPRFKEQVGFERAKPGAEVLAVTPARDVPAAGSHILLATQAFGAGRATVLATDTLWRWKLSEPSSSRAVETFWQQLLLAIGRARSAASLQFVETPPRASIGTATTLRLSGGGPAGSLPRVVARAPDGRESELALKRLDDPAASWAIEWTPDREGVWEIAATAPDLVPARVFPMVTAAPAGELAPAAPAIERMRALAGETGGSLLTDAAPETWTGAAHAARVDGATAERTVPRWNQWGVLALVLGCFGLELVLRRVWKLL